MSVVTLAFAVCGINGPENRSNPLKVTHRMKEAAIRGFCDAEAPAAVVGALGASLQVVAWFGWLSLSVDLWCW